MRLLTFLVVGMLFVGSADAALIFLDSDGQGSVDLAPGESVEISIMVTIRAIDPGFSTGWIYLNDDDNSTDGEIKVTALAPDGAPEENGLEYDRSDFSLPADLSRDVGNEFNSTMITFDHTNWEEAGGDGIEATVAIDTITVTHIGSSTEGTVPLTFESGARAPNVFYDGFFGYPFGLGLDNVIPGFIDPGVGAEDNPFIINLVPGPISFAYPHGLPEDVVEPNAEISVLVTMVAEESEPAPGTGTVSYRIDDGAFITLEMVELAPNEYEATLPALDCGQVLDFYFSAETADGVMVNDPGAAPESTSSTVAAVAFHDFNDDPGWTATGNADCGFWERETPDGGGHTPVADYDGSGVCFLTEVGHDVDDGFVVLTSVPYDLSGRSDPQVRYARWFLNSTGEDPGVEDFVVEVSDDGGFSWVNLETVGPEGDEVNAGWFDKTFRIADFVAITDQFKIRFIASDTSFSTVEAAVDAFEICDAAACEGDANGDGTVDPLDSGFVLARFGCEVGGGDPDCDAADQNGDGAVDPLDSGFVLARFGTCD